jgi:hypothetical protein
MLSGTAECSVTLSFPADTISDRLSFRQFPDFHPDNFIQKFPSSVGTRFEY